MEYCYLSHLSSTYTWKRKEVKSCNTLSHTRQVGMLMNSYGDGPVVPGRNRRKPYINEQKQYGDSVQDVEIKMILGILFSFFFQRGNDTSSTINLLYFFLSPKRIDAVIKVFSYVLYLSIYLLICLFTYRFIYPIPYLSISLSTSHLI